MQDKSDKSSKDSSPELNAKNAKPGSKYRARLRRRAMRMKKPSMLLDPGSSFAGDALPDLVSKQSRQGYDPELLYVECGRCGSPVLWEEGRAGRLLLEAGIDPLELDSSCILLTDGCPACGSAKEYSVRIFRLSDQGATNIVPLHGHA